MQTIIAQWRMFYNRHAFVILFSSIFLLLYLLISPFLGGKGIVLMAYYRRIPAFVLLYYFVNLFYKEQFLLENKWLRFVSRFFCFLMLLVSPVLCLFACIGMPEDNGWDVRCQQRIPYNGMDVVEWFYGGGATVSNNTEIRLEKKLLPGLLYIRQLYSSESENSLILSIQNDTLNLKDPWNKNLLDRHIDLRSGTYIDKNIPPVKLTW